MQEIESAADRQTEAQTEIQPEIQPENKPETQPERCEKSENKFIKLVKKKRAVLHRVLSCARHGVYRAAG